MGSRGRLGQVSCVANVAIQMGATTAHGSRSIGRPAWDLLGVRWRRVSVAGSKDESRSAGHGLRAKAASRLRYPPLGNQATD